MGFQSCRGVDNFKAFPFASEEYGSDYYYDEELA
jgi:hypothetical protein